MALDGIFLNLVRAEIEAVLLDGRVDKLYQPSRDELVLSFRTRLGSAKLFCSADANSARVCLTKAEIENPKVPPMFCMLLRKRLMGAKLTRVRQDGFERILFFDFDATDELGDPCRLTLVAEIMGRRSNLILTAEDGRILDSIKRVGQDISRVRTVLPGVAYALPPRDARLTLFEITTENLQSALAAFGTMPLSKALVKTLEGISPVFAEEAVFYCTRGADASADRTEGDTLDRLVFFLKKTADDLRAGKNVFTIIKTKDGIFKDFCFCAVSYFGGLMVTRTQDSACGLLDSFFTERDQTARLKQRAGDLFRLLVNTSDRIARRIAAQREELLACADRERLRVAGDLLTANLYRIEKGAAQATVENYFEPDAPQISIALDTRLSPSANAQKYFAEYRKAAQAEKMLTGLVAQGEQELAYIDSVFDALTRAQGENEIAELRLELAEQGYIKKNRGREKPPKSAPPLKFISSDGFTILAGRNNKQNDKLTLKDAAKLDIWLHTHNIPGSHVIIQCSGKTPPQRTLNEAAVLAALFSKAKSSAQVPVDYTLVKNVKKPGGARPGMVIFTDNTTLFVKPDEAAAEQLKARA
ncbi:MAG: NFACT RNA binding domain-containing protein [Oscillospiraceae bacterium]